MLKYENLVNREASVAVVGLGYVGLPLAVALSRHFKVIGFDVSAKRIEELGKGYDRCREVEESVLKDAAIDYTVNPARLSETALIIVAVPTPIDIYRRPDLGPVSSASATVGKYMRQGTVVVFESTVYPGLTEEICVPLLQKHSGLAFGRDFQVGYSPERINPGDKVHTLESIVKVVSGSNPATTELLAAVYGCVVAAGIHKAPNIRTAEAAKVIENTQRDLNIALMNELSLIFERMGIDTLDVLAASGTKWNFLPFRPGLVGGHCIGVDPYYLTFKAEELGYHPQVILAGRRINDGMGKHVALMLVKELIRKNVAVNGARVGILGLTFKENVPDLRNTRVVDVIRELEDFNINVLVHDSLAYPEEALEEYSITLSALDDLRGLDGLILAVAHDEYKALSARMLKGWFNDPSRAAIVDIKGLLDVNEALNEGVALKRL